VDLFTGQLLTSAIVLHVPIRYISCCRNILPFPTPPVANEGLQYSIDWVPNVNWLHSDRKRPHFNLTVDGMVKESSTAGLASHIVGWRVSLAVVVCKEIAVTRKEEHQYQRSVVHPTAQGGGVDWLPGQRPPKNAWQTSCHQIKVDGKINEFASKTRIIFPRHCGSWYIMWRDIMVDFEILIIISSLREATK